MSDFIYKIMTFNSKDDVPKPRPALKTEITEGMDFNEAIGRLIFNMNTTREHSDDTRAYSQAVMDAVDNEIAQAKLENRATGRSRAQTKAYTAKTQAKNEQAAKNLNNQMTANANKAAASRRAAQNKQVKKAKQEG